MIERLDVLTLTVVLIVLSGVNGAILVSVTSPLRGAGALAYWSRGLLALTTGAIVLVSRDFIPTFISVVVGNSLIIFAFTQLGEVGSSLTNAYLNGRHRWMLFFATGPVLGLLYGFVDALWPRAAYVALVETFICAQLAWQIHEVRQRAEKPLGSPVKAFEILLWFFVAETVLRTAAVFYLVPQESFFRQAVIATAMLFGIIFIVLATCILIWHELDVKERAIRLLSTIDADFDIPNRHLFLEQLAVSLDSRRTPGMDYAALIRVVPDSVAGFHFDPLEDSVVYRAVGDLIGRHLDAKCLLAHYSEIEFGVLIRGRDRAEATALLKSILEELHATPIASAHGDYRMIGTAAATACGLSIGNPTRAIKVLKAGLAVTELGTVGFYAIKQPEPSQSATDAASSTPAQRQAGH